MRGIEDEIDELTRLDELRIEAATYRDEARNALRAVLRRSAPRSWDWKVPKRSHGRALLVRALCFDGYFIESDLKRPLDRQIAALEKEALASLEEAEEAIPIPVLRFARTMQALVATPSSAFSTAALVLYYQLIREIYSAHAPDWATGGARAGKQGISTAFATGECIRAILGFATAMQHTQQILEEMSAAFSQLETLQHPLLPIAWTDPERERICEHLHLKIKEFGRNLAIGMPLPTRPAEGDIRELKSDINKYLKISIRSARDNFVRARKVIERRRRQELGAGARAKRVDRSLFGHEVALNAVVQAIENAKEALSVLSTSQGAVTKLRTLARLFGQATLDTRNLLHPARRFVSSVLDRELAAAAATDRGWDPAEMTFAAASLGAATTASPHGAFGWHDERLGRAAGYLSGLLSIGGRFPVGRAIYTGQGGETLHVISAQVSEAFAQLLEHLPEVPVDAKLCGRLLQLFRDSRVKGTNDQSGWSHLGPEQPTGPEMWATAIASVALDRVNRMLDSRINQRVFEHFSVRRPHLQQSSPRLEQLFYPDYGLISAGDKAVRRNLSIASSLLRMRAHCLKLDDSEAANRRLHSLILHGPPGTGKTTLVEALSASSQVPLVEITPSDIVSGGAEAVERRTRAVFKALSFVTRSVIMFDEFDPILKRREKSSSEPTSIFSFLTPGMLPKLKTLNESAKRRGVCYILITNIIGVLDDAAIREGRFDLKLAVFPPDPLSRAGRLLSEFLQWKGREEISRNEERRICIAVARTQGAPMNALGRRGWYVRPRTSRADKGTLFRFLTSGGKEPDWPRPEAEFKESAKLDGQWARLEEEQWQFIIDWDRYVSGLGKTARLADALIVASDARR